MRICLPLYIYINIFLFIVTVLAKNDDNLAALVIMMRHGERIPGNTYPTDPYNESFWPANQGGLTEVGIRNQFLLGQMLGKRYRNFFGQTYDENSVHVIASNTSRTVTSAMYTVQGIFTTTSNYQPILNKELIKIDVLKSKDDNILLKDKNCPTLNNLFHVEHTEYEDYLFSYLSNSTQMPINDLKQVFILYRMLYNEAHFNLTLPEWTKAIYPDILEEQVLHYLMSQIETTDKARLVVGPLWNLILSFFRNYLSSPEISAKILLIVGHEDSLFYLLNTLWNFDNIIPPVSSCIIFELRHKIEENNVSYYVDTYFKNSTGFTQINIRNCNFSCDFKEVLKKLESIDINPCEWDTECNYVDVSYMRTAVIIIAITLLVICAASWVCYYTTLKKKSRIV